MRMNNILDVGRVQHHTDASTEGVGRDVRAEFRLDNTGASVRAGNTSSSWECKSDRGF